MLQPAHPDDVRHAQALHEKGWKPGLEPGPMLARVYRQDGSQDVEVGTWQVMVLLGLKVRWEVS